MSKEEAIEFLSANQPMPPDLHLDQERMNKYDEAIILFSNDPDPICIPLFLFSFGDGSGFGMYQLVEGIIVQFDADEVVPHLFDALHSENEGVRYWNAQIAQNFSEKLLLDPLGRLLSDSSVDIRYSAAVALCNIGGTEVSHVFKESLVNEEDEEIRMLMYEFLNGSSDEKV